MEEVKKEAKNAKVEWWEKISEKSLYRAAEFLYWYKLIIKAFAVALLYFILALGYAAYEAYQIYEVGNDYFIEVASEMLEKEYTGDFFAAIYLLFTTLIVGVPYLGLVTVFRLIVFLRWEKRFIAERDAQWRQMILRHKLARGRNKAEEENGKE